jgi:hypothetical protein
MRRNRRLPIPQHEFGFAPAVFNLRGEALAPETTDEAAEQARRRRAAAQATPTFDEADCGGAFDGFTVTSDADPGL